MVEKFPFGKMQDGSEVFLYRIGNSGGASLSVINYGGIIQSLNVPDRQGVFRNVVLGFETLEEYQRDAHYVGAVVGRFANRIAKGSISIDGILYSLTQNDRGNHLHGGPCGFNKVFWSAEIIADNSVKLYYNSPDGDGGYPGNLHAEVTYTLTDQNELQVAFRATTDKATIANLVQHSYFNLGEVGRNILEHELLIKSHHYLLVNDLLIPTGEKFPVANTPFDFILPKPVGKSLKDADIQLQYGKGYDHSWVLDHPSRGINHAATLAEKRGGIAMTVFTDKPGLHVYTGNFINDKFPAYPAICLETQYFPDAPNQPHVESGLLRPGKQYESTTIFKFSIQ